MSSNKHRATFVSQAPDSKKTRLTMDDAIVAMELQHQLSFPTDDEKQRNIKIYNDKIRANELEVQNALECPLLRLPQEIKNEIYEAVFHERVLRITTINGKARLAHASHLHTFALPSVCRMLHQETKDLPYTKTTFAIATFRFVSLLDTWHDAISSDPNTFLDFLETIPGPYIQRFEIIGVMRGSDGVEEMRLPAFYRYCNAADHKDKMIKYLSMVYPEAEITFRTVDNVDQL